MFDSGDPSHGLHEPAPDAALPGEDLAALRRQPIKTTAPLAGALDPPSADPAPLLEAIEQRIERRDLEPNQAAGLLFDQLADFVAMPRPVLEKREDQQLRAALLQLPVEHPLHM